MRVSSLTVLILTVLYGRNHKTLCNIHNTDSRYANVLSSNNVLKNVVKHSPVITENTINNSELNIIKTAHKNEDNMLNSIDKCVKNYALPCPKNWILKKVMNNQEEKKEAEQNICIANKNYNGFCETSISFDNFSDHDKMNFELSCNVEWDCKHMSNDSICDSENNEKRDYSSPCPIGFIAQNDNSCVADISVYKGMCNVNNINFTHMTDIKKEEWSVSCDAYWPCYAKCKSNETYSKCPRYWIETENSFECKPTQQYTGPCKQQIKNFKYYTENMKIEFENICKTKFECITDDNETKCEDRDYDQTPCPSGWSIQKGYCLAPQSQTVCNKTKLSIENLTTKEKKQFEKDCLVKWPCKKENDLFCKIDWSGECPEGWSKQVIYKTSKSTIENDNYVCINNNLNKLSVNKKCEQIFMPINATEETKREIASNCNSPWPCMQNTEKIPIDPSSIQYKKYIQNKKGNSSGVITSEGLVLSSTSTPNNATYKKKTYNIIDEDEHNIYKDIMK